MIDKLQLSYEEQVKVVEVYKQYGTYKKTALILNIPLWKVSRIIYRLEGRCDCGRPMPEDKMKCDVCRERTNRSKNRRYNERKEQGLCVQCGQPRGDSPSTVYYREHNEHERLTGSFRRRERRKLGLSASVPSSNVLKINLVACMRK